MFREHTSLDQSQSSVMVRCDSSHSPLTESNFSNFARQANLFVCIHHDICNILSRIKEDHYYWDYWDPLLRQLRTRGRYVRDKLFYFIQTSLLFISDIPSGEEGWFVIFRIFKFILIFVNFIVLFQFLIKYYHILFIIILCGTILMTPCSMVWDWRVSRAGSMHCIGLAARSLFVSYCFPFLFFFLWVGVVGLGSSDW